MITNRHITRLFLPLAAVVLAGVFCACAGPVAGDPAAPQELSFSARGDALILDGEPATRGYVTGVSLTDDVLGNRPLYVTAYLHPQSGVAKGYLCNDVFHKSGDEWRRTPPVYWPMEGRLDFMVYSSGVPFDPMDITWGPDNTAERMRLNVGRDHLQDDILVGSSWGSTSSAGVPTALSMHHCQAWIEVSLKLVEGSTQTISVTSVSLADAYLDGVLNVENNFGSPSLEWDFRASEGRDRVIDDPEGVFGTTLTSSEVTVKMLIPEQPQTKLIVKYVVDGEEKEAVKELPHTNWIAGRKYVYAFEFGSDPVFEP